MLPLTPLRGIVVPGFTNYDGVWLIPGLRKDRVRTWFHFPGWRGFGLNVISLNRPKRWWFRYREDVIWLLSRHYDMYVELFNENAQKFQALPLHEDNWEREPQGHETMLISAYSNIDGGYVGDPETALMLLRRGIEPRKRKDSLNVCSIGYCPREKKWYGWSHRAMYGFGIGSTVDSSDHCCATSGWTDDYLAEHPEDDIRLPVGFTAKSLEDARLMASVFADSVS